MTEQFKRFSIRSNKLKSLSPIVGTALIPFKDISGALIAITSYIMIPRPNHNGLAA